VIFDKLLCNVFVHSNMVFQTKQLVSNIHSLNWFTSSENFTIGSPIVNFFDANLCLKVESRWNRPDFLPFENFLCNNFCFILVFNEKVLFRLSKAKFLCPQNKLFRRIKSFSVIIYNS